MKCEQMRNENLELAQSSGSESSPSWASNTPRASEFSFDFAHRTIDDLTNQFKVSVNSEIIIYLSFLFCYSFSIHFSYTTTLNQCVTAFSIQDFSELRKNFISVRTLLSLYFVPCTFTYSFKYFYCSSSVYTLI